MPNSEDDEASESSNTFQVDLVIQPSYAILLS